MNVNLEQLEAMAGESTRRRGKAYYREGRVKVLSADGERVIAEVRGSGSNVYRTHLQESAGELVARCSCPVGLNCKHGVAVAYRFLESKRDAAPPAAGLEHWLSALDQASALQAHALTHSLRPGSHHLLYELLTGTAASVGQPGARLRILKSYLKKNGEWGQSKAYTAATYEYMYLPPAFLRPADLEVLRLLPHRRTAERSLSWRKVPAD